MKIGIDIDGVLARFETSYAALLSDETGGITFPVYAPDEPKTWFWERDHFAKLGWSREDAKAVESKVWVRITAKGSTFWEDLAPFPTALETIEWLNAARQYGEDVYFITTRPGFAAKFQTERWLRRHGMLNPTVLIATSDASKGQLVKALKLDVFIDDKPENCAEVNVALEQHTLPEMGKLQCRVFLVDAPYNRNIEGELNTYLHGVERVESALQALERVGVGYGESIRRAA
jgi:uncharacterized HAD superfamily protein